LNDKPISGIVKAETEMTAEEKFEFWFEYAQNDLDTAEAMFKSGRWMYVYIRVVQKLQFLNNFRLKTVKCLAFCKTWERTIRFSNKSITCQQALEKLVKGLYLLYVDDNIPACIISMRFFQNFPNACPNK
jgi:hypothetical protein